MFTEPANNRDLKIDFLRGFVMVILIVVHIDVFSIFTFVAWERIGMISGAEGFVILSGIVLGIVQRRRSQNNFKEAALRLLQRSALLYRINISISLAILCVSLFPFIDLSILKTFTDWHIDKTYNLFPSNSASWHYQLTQILMLRSSPHQIQILGLYCVLLAFSPLAIWLFKERRYGWVLGVSWIMYFYHMTHTTRLVGAQFEYAFPVLSWQLIFFHGLAYGYFKDEISIWVAGTRLLTLRCICASLAIAFLLFAWNSPNSAFPEWASMRFVDPQTFNTLRSDYFDKSKLGLLRVVNYFVFLVGFYWFISSYWTKVNKVIGWLLVPLGQASLYVFIMHLLFVYGAEAITNFGSYAPKYETSKFLLNSLIHVGSIMLLWAMVRYRFAYSFVPR